LIGRTFLNVLTSGWMFLVVNVFFQTIKKKFGRPHLLQCPWYLELKENERCPGEERALKASCDNMMQQLEAENLVHIEEDASEVGDDNSISDK
jgi:hypothetical protein